jgi:hypothetical protein
MPAHSTTPGAPAGRIAGARRSPCNPRSARFAAIPVERRLALWEETIAASSNPALRNERLSCAPPRSARLSAEGLTEALEIVLGGALGPAAAELARRAGAREGDAAPALAGVVLAGNIPGLAAQSLLPALLLGRPLLLKCASSEPWFAPALIAALVAREPALADAFAAVVIAGDDRAALTAAFGDRPAPRLRRSSSCRESRRGLR